ncbi:unnamed protein product [Blepharisma stoltei]|uniref:Rap-GAP domain-containing protein n=1 Tax=Blepharisma stoltei TaxID=1481888 RepID=A0AAU9IRX6_9CILI|nr:unnamed protein product [Blepharisma stoltei]
MKGLTSWFMGKSIEEERARLLFMLDPSKPLRKRFSIMIQIVRNLEKTVTSGYNEKLHEFFQENWDTATTLCLAMLKNADHIKTKGKGAAWEDVSSILKVIMEITQYGQMQDLEEIQEIAIVCLFDDNRWEIKEIGFNLVLFLLNTNLALQVPQHLFLASIDLSQFRSEEHGEPVFPDRSILITGSNSQHPWLNLAQDSLKKSSPIYQAEVKELEKLAGQALSQGVKDCLNFVSKALDFSLDSDYPPSLETRQAHFKRWFNLLKKTMLFLIYPYYCTPGDNMSPDWGFHSFPPPTLHYLVATWLIKAIRDQELLDALFITPEEYDFVGKVLGLSFRLTESYSGICYKTANKCLRLYEDWIFGKFLPRIIKSNIDAHISSNLKHTIDLFDFSNDFSPKRIDLCKLLINLLEKYREQPEGWPTLLECSINISNKLAETHDLKKPFHDIIEPMAEFLISTLSTVMTSIEVDWNSFSKILQKWARNSEPIIEHWEKIMIDNSSKLKDLSFRPCSLLEGWLKLMYILGDPLKFSDKVQVRWAHSLQDLINLIVTPPQTASNPNRLLQFFFPILSKLIRSGSVQETQVIALNSLTALFINTKCEEMPMECYIQHLSLILYHAAQQPHLQISVLEAAPRLLDFPGMHFLINTFLQIAYKNHLQATKLIFYIMCFPNYYKDTALYDPTTQYMTYASLKPKIRGVLQACAEDPELSSTALYGLTCFILEEINSGNDSASQLITEIILEKCLSDNDDTALAAFRCLNSLTPVMTMINKTVLNFLMFKALESIPITREKVLKAALATIQHLVMTSSTALDSNLLTSLFSNLSLLESKVAGITSLENEISSLSSFLAIYYLNFPLKNQNPVIFQSITSDEEFAEEKNFRTLHFALETNAIVTIIFHSSKAKFIIRNQFGKFCWEAEDYKIFEPSARTEEFSRIVEEINSTSIEIQNQDPPKKLDDEPLLPLLIDYIASNYSDCYVKDKQIEAGSEMLRLMDSVEEMEAECEIFERRREREATAFNVSRYFVSNFGLLEKLILLESGEKLDRGLSLLDNCQPREPVKIGIIYVGPGQQDEKEILANSSGSIGFQQFVQNIGRVIDIRQHLGNLGGLDPSGSAGYLSVSYSDWQYDVLFHVVSLMPTDLNDEQQVLKKRHVGNDIVHIIWSDHWRDYRQDTMLTHFNFILIVIYPLSPMLFRIQILKKVNVDCGPLQDGMVIPWSLLPILVRQTAINANQQVRAMKHANYEKQIHIRRKQILELVQRYSVLGAQKNQTYAQMF